MLPGRDLCCGCSACYAICPKQAIAMRVDAEGFLQPVINSALCIKCGLCEKVCPVLHPDKSRMPLSVYVAKAKDEALRLRSSSGGVFSLLAREVFKQEGIVYGAGWERPSMRVVHKSAETEDELEDLCGSKYVQSDMGNTYCQVRNQLNSGRVVLFSGCPCQIAGLKHFLEKDYDNLVCVDLICHSIGSPGVFHRFISYLTENKGRVKSIMFREKTIAWKSFYFRVQWESGEELLVPFNQTFYALAWWSGLIARRSCFGCKFKEFRSLSDLTIGDAWGIENFAPEMDDEKGCSIVFLSENKKLFKKIEKMEMHKVDFASAVMKNPCVLNASRTEGDKLDKVRQAFFKEINHKREGLSKKSLRWFNPPWILVRIWNKGLKILGYRLSKKRVK